LAESQDSPFPIRIGAIDVGSNAIRFLAAEFTDPSHWVELDNQRLPIRLGHSAFLTGRLEDESMAAAIEALSSFRSAFDKFGISRYRAVATSAVRESENGGELVRRIREESGILLETITGSEEGRLVWLAARGRLDMRKGLWLLADLGGGSLELSLGDEKRIRWSVSHQIGTVRLLEDLDESHSSPEKFRKLVAEYAQTLRLPRKMKKSKVAGVVATGGNADVLAQIVKAPADSSGVRRIPIKALREAARELGEMSVKERMERFDLRADRADVVFPAALVYERVASLADADELVIPGVGVKEGILLDLVDDVTGPAVHATKIEQQLLNAAIALGRRYRFDEAHGRHVARLSLSLFDQLKSVHKLGSADRKILLGAALLHDIGQVISYRRHHKHSMYLILNSELPGVSEEDTPLVALVARYHRRAEPADDHEFWTLLDSDRQQRIRKLASILRIADALDREHLQRVEQVEAKVKDDKLRLETSGHGDLLLEQWAIARKAKMFRTTFDLEVEVDAVSLGPALI
jgi:exopolyphosphatase/guanosine-5'-triphosphate,3'-diphosphate pyrophosphatase